MSSPNKSEKTLLRNFWSSKSDRHLPYLLSMPQTNCVDLIKTFSDRRRSYNWGKQLSGQHRELRETDKQVRLDRRGNAPTLVRISPCYRDHCSGPAMRGPGGRWSPLQFCWQSRSRPVASRVRDGPAERRHETEQQWKCHKCNSRPWNNVHQPNRLIGHKTMEATVQFQTTKKAAHIGRGERLSTILY